MDDLVEAANAVRAHAYAPYSGFPVGAAIRSASYPCGVCAEASAISAMVAAGGRRIEAIAVAGPGGALTTPCGNCRQKIREFARPEVSILVCDPEGLKAAFTFADLLPEAFGPDHLA